MVQPKNSVESASYRHAFSNLTIGTFALVILVAILYLLLLKRRSTPPQPHPPAPTPETQR